MKTRNGMILMKTFANRAWIPAFAGMTKKVIQNRGFTLIEVIVLIVLAGILLPVIITPFVTSVKGSGKPEMATKAMYLAHQRMEDLMKYDYCNAALNPVAATGLAPIPGFATYQWEWSIYYVDNNFANPDLVNNRGYKRIYVHVRDPMNNDYTIYSVVTLF